MKTISIIFIGLMLTMSSCKKVAESVALIGTWKVDKYYEDGADKTNDFNTMLSNYQLKFETNGTFTETAMAVFIPLTVTGPWEINNNGNNLKLTNSADQTVRNYGLSGLTAKKMTLKEGSNKEYRLVKL
ncbi:MAG: lipocalin family protein [Bacteroidetes bacterium]|nr:lipocalin family protein [Bacteroidota bacterium]